MNTTDALPTADQINAHLSAGGVVKLSNPRWESVYRPKHAGMFYEYRGELRVRHGKRFITVSEPGVGLLLAVQLGHIVRKGA